MAKQYRALPGSKILEVGCGSGEFWLEASKIIPSNCTITLTDFSAGMLENIQKKLEHIANYRFEVADVEQLPYLDQAFDIVFAHLMLYHAHSPEQGLKEIKRVLKYTGYAGILLSGEEVRLP